MQTPWRWLVALILGTAVGSPGSAQEAPAPKEFEVPFWQSDRSLQMRAAVALIGTVDPLGALGTRVAIGENVPMVPGWVFEFDRVLPIDQRYLDLIKDGRTLPNVSAKELKELALPDRGLYLALTESLRRSEHATTEMFEKSAEENKHAVYAHLRADPQRYRGKIITVKGKLALIRREDPPRYLHDDAITDIYTGWIVGPTKGAPPFTIVFTQLPKGLSVSENLDVPVTFEGYFLSHIRFPADKDAGQKKDVISPYLVGKTVIVQPDATPEVKTVYAYPIIVTAVGGVLAVAVLGAVLIFCFRRGDQKTQSQIAQVRDKNLPFTLEPDTPSENQVE